MFMAMNKSLQPENDIDSMCQAKKEEQDSLELRKDQRKTNNCSQ